ncbi:MAG: dihydrolipoamide acetyltransferase family protein [Allosphingosinicella sp.]
MGTFDMPSLGADMEAGTLVEWLKRPGDPVHRGDIIAVVETEKGAIDVEIFEDGTVESLLVGEGEKVPVGTPLARIAGTGEPPPKAEPTAVPDIEKLAPKPAPVPAPTVETLPRPAAEVPHSGAAVRASPAARRLAAELGLDISAITGSGPDGAVIRADLERSAKPPEKERAGIDLDQMRRAIAAAMARSKREIPHYYLSHSFDAGAASEAVDEFNSGQPPEGRILLGALLVKAVALAMRDFPEFNGAFGPDGFRPSAAIHVGVAVAIRGGGLAAPAIHDTDQLGLPDLMARMRDMIGRVRRGGFRSSELSDPTVTVSSLGERGVEALLPIIYPPQVAIVGFGALQQRPWIVGDRVEPRPVLTASLAGDHRVSDGHRGALLLRRIEELLQNPESL